MGWSGVWKKEIWGRSSDAFQGLPRLANTLQGLQRPVLVVYIKRAVRSHHQPILHKGSARREGEGGNEKLIIFLFLYMAVAALFGAGGATVF